MMSLFSSFDYYWSFLPFSTEIFIILLLFLSVYNFNSLAFCFGVFHNFMASFMGSLVPSGFSKFTPSMLLSILYFVFLLNFYSVFPYIFPHTSQVSLVLVLGLGFWSSFMIFSNFHMLKGFLGHCIPEGSPLPLVPALFVIELVSNFIRPITLTVRLVANILAGHLLLILLSKVVVSVSWAFLGYFLLNVVEFFVAIVQSYIFLTMIALYYCDVN